LLEQFQIVANKEWLIWYIFNCNWVYTRWQWYSTH